MLNESGTFLVVRPVTTRGLVYDLCGALPLIDDVEVVARLAEIVNVELRKLRMSPGRFVEIALASGQKFDVDMHDEFGAKLAHGYFQEAADWNVVSRFVSPGVTAIDVGANVGVYTLELARRAGPDGCVVAFEPIPEIAATLRGNIDKNGYENVIVRREAASKIEGSADFYVAESASLSGLFPTARNHVSAVSEVRLVPLDSVQELEGRAVGFLKIDAEGSEVDVIEGARALIARSPELVIMLEHSAKNTAGERLAHLMEVLQELAAAGFRIYPGNAATTPISMKDAEELQPGATGNLFLCRSGSAGEARFLHAAAQVAAITPSTDEVKRRLSATVGACLRLVRAAELAQVADGLKNVDSSVGAAVERLEILDSKVGDLGRGVDELGSHVRNVHESQARLVEIAEASKKWGFRGLLRRLSGRE